MSEFRKAKRDEASCLYLLTEEADVEKVLFGI